MKTQLIRNIAVTLLAATCMFAEEANRVKVEIPFGFHVGSSMLPAGRYTVAADVKTGVVQLRSSDCKSAVMILTAAIRPQSKSDSSKLVFNRYGNEYFLSRIWTTVGVDGRELRKTPQEFRSAVNTSPAMESIMARK